jgi:hypothetical protein
VRWIKEEHAEYIWYIYVTFYTHLIWFFAFNRLNFQVMEVEINLQQSKYAFNTLPRYLSYCISVTTTLQADPLKHSVTIFTRCSNIENSALCLYRESNELSKKSEQNKNTLSGRVVSTHILHTLTLKHSAICPHTIFVFHMILTINSSCFPKQH